ncbi:unnamed protein product [Symbiodinium sp. CCMP2592]|nr:unnamed protein product [Symbiodinium sp. CCMP2592]
MEEDDDPLWRTEAAVKPKSLNEDPFNVFAEEQAVEACKVGFEVATELLETDLVFTSCGSLVKGTPDGGFVDTDGLLRLVQVVRVPLLPDMDEDEVADVLFDTVLAKVVKSQTWMKERTDAETHVTCSTFSGQDRKAIALLVQRRLLLSHHATNRSLGHLLMGRGGPKYNDKPWKEPWKGKGEGKGGDSRHDGKWSLWPGAYKASPRGGRPDKNDKQKPPAFPAYDASWRQAAQMMEVSTLPSSQAGGRGIVRDVQGAVNAARRFEQKLAKSRKELLQKGQAWDSWVLQMRSSYHKGSWLRLLRAFLPQCGLPRRPRARRPVLFLQLLVATLLRKRVSTTLISCLAELELRWSPTHCNLLDWWIRGSHHSIHNCQIDLQPSQPLQASFPRSGRPGPVPADTGQALLDDDPDEMFATFSPGLPGRIEYRASLGKLCKGFPLWNFLSLFSVGACPKVLGSGRHLPVLPRYNAATPLGPFGLKELHCLLYAPGYASEHHDISLSLPALVDSVLQSLASRSSLLMRLATAQIVPVRPQPEEGYASLVVCPLWVSRSHKAVVVLDFSAFEGPTYACIVPSCLAYEDLDFFVQKHICDPWSVFIGDASRPLPFGDSCSVQNGTLVTFVQADTVHWGLPPLEHFLLSPDEWIECPRKVRKELPSDHWLLFLEEDQGWSTRLLPHDGDFDDELCSVIATKMHRRVESVSFCMPEAGTNPAIVFDGYATSRIIAATFKNAGASTPECVVFLDARQMGKSLRCLKVRTPLLTMREAVQSLCLVPVSGFRSYAEHPRLEVEGLAIANGNIVALGLETDPNALSPRSAERLSGAASLHPSASGERIPLTEPGGGLLMEASDDRAAKSATVRFLVCAPAFAIEQVDVKLDLPCSVHAAGQLLANARGETNARRFEYLVPAKPQPDLGFAVVLAAPLWAELQVFVLVDTRLLDSRMFLFESGDRLSRQAFLTKISVIDRPGLRIFVRGYFVPEAEVIIFAQGDTVSVLPPGTPLGYMTDLDYLLNEQSWRDLAPVHLAGPSPSAFGLLFDEGFKVVEFDLSKVQSGRDFKIATACFLQYDLGRVRFQPADPKIRDFAHRGQGCQAIFVATEAIPHSAVGGDPNTNLNILFFDLRALLRGLEWRIHEGETLLLAPLVREFSAGKPAGYEVVITGGTPIDSGQGPALRVSPGSVIVVEYYHDFLNEPYSIDVDSADIPDNDHDEEEEEESSSTSSSSSTPARIGARNRIRSRSEGRLRSRSRGRTHVHHVTLMPGLPHHRCQPAHRCGHVRSSPYPPAGLPTAVLMLASLSLAQATHLRTGVPDSLVAWGQLHVQAFLALLGSLSGYIACKWLAEPTSSRADLRQAIAFLRFSAPMMGTTWRYVPDADAEFIHVSGDSDSEGSTEDDPVIWAHFAIAVPGYTLERVLVALRFPATIEEALAAVRQARRPAEAGLFPTLIAADPQPCPGAGLLLALPERELPRCMICVDATLFDRRLFSVLAPAYVCRSQLLALANFQDNLGVQVFLGSDQQPLANEEMQHVRSGTTVSFLPLDVGRQHPFSLGQLLASRYSWSQHSSIPALEDANAYCLAYDWETILHIADPRHPTDYRRHIAACVGADSRSLKLCPAAPRVDNVVLDGVLCRTAIAVCAATQGAAPVRVGVLIDARALLMGWRSISLLDGWIRPNRVLGDYSQDVPPGWVLRIRDVPERAEFIHVHDGQVLTLCIHKILPAEPARLVHHAPDTANTAPAGSAHADAAPSVPRVGSAGEAYPDDALNAAAPGFGEALEVVDPGANVEDPAFIDAPFLVVGPAYTPELVQIRFRVATPPAQVLRQVNAARAPEPCFHLPRIIAAHPQSVAGIGVAVALPIWEPNGAIILVDLSRVNGAVFSVQAPNRVDRRTILALAELPLDQGHQAYVHDLPWPVPDGGFVNVRHGDAVVVLEAHSPHFATASFVDILGSVHGWNVEWAPGLEYRRSFWVLTAYRPFLLHVEADRRDFFRADIAQRLAVPPGRLLLCPTEPNIVNFAHIGLPAQGVLAAVVRNGPLSVRHADVNFFLDCRPLLLGISWRTSPDGILRAESIWDQYRTRCPAGWVLGWSRAQNRPEFLHSDIQVGEGEVITINILPLDFFEGFGQNQPPSYPPPPPSSERPDADGSQPTASEHARSASSSDPVVFSARDAGTGGSHSYGTSEVCAVRKSGIRRPIWCFRQSRVAKWPAGFSVRVPPTGSLWVTPVLLCPGPFTWVLLVFALLSQVGVVQTVVRLTIVCASLAVPGQGAAGRRLALLVLIGLSLPTAEAMHFQPPLSIAGSCAGPPYTESVSCWTHCTRPLPTPVRAARALCAEQAPYALDTWVSPDAAGNGQDTLDLDVLTTLLEESVSDPANEAFFRAATLLEVLAEHFAEGSATSTVNLSVAPDRRPTQILLFESLAFDRVPSELQANGHEESRLPLVHWKRGLRPHGSVHATCDIFGADYDRRLAFGDVPLPFTPRQLHQLFRPDFCTLSIADCLDALQPSQRHILRRLVDQPEDSLPWDLVCYTDGSFVPSDGTRSSRAGWACIFLHRTRQECDIISGTLPSWCVTEDSDLSAFKAECCALVVALWLGTSVTAGVPFTILSDCQAAVAIANGEAAAHSSGIAVVLGHVAECCRAVATRPAAIVHTPGHAGTLGNEIADVSAKAAAHGLPHGWLSWEVDKELNWWDNQGEKWSWASLVCRWAAGDDALPSPLGDNIHLERHNAGLSVEQLLEPFLPPPSKSSDLERWGAIGLRISSYNALSLATERHRVAEEGLAFQPARPALLAGQLHEAGIHCAAIQETRTAEGVVSTSGFLRFCSGATKGHLGGSGAPSTNRRPGIDLRALTDPANAGTVDGILQRAPRPEWSVSADAHVAIVTSYLQTSLAQAFPKTNRRPLHPYLSNDAWDLQQHVARLRRKCVAVKHAIRRQTLCAVFAAWRHLPQVAPAGSAAWLRDWQVADALYGFRLGVLAKTLKARCKADRAAYLANLADEVQAGRAFAFQSVNRMLGRRRKKPFAPAVLPAVQELDGSLCASPEAAMRRWREHFSALEDGVEVSRDELPELSALCQGADWPSPSDVRVLPTPLALQQALLAAKRGKASGPDSLPGELGLLFAPGMQRLLYPLLLKLGLLGEEAVGHKSGCLTWLWKGRGSQSDCASFRGILLLSNLCKSLHRAYRPCIRDHFEAQTPPLQLGGKPGGSVIFGSHLARTFMRWRAASGGSSAILFADVSSAYYCAIRELTSKMPVRASEQGEELCSDDPMTLEFQLRAPSAMERTGASPWLQALTTAINSGTWMHLQGDHVPVSTRRGTRPGSAWADLSFGILVGRILQLRDSCRAPQRQDSVVPSVPWDGARHWGPIEASTQHIDLDDLIWADDLSTFLHINNAVEAASIVAVETGALSDAFSGHGLQLTFGQRKTAALISLRGPGARSARRNLFSGQASLCVLRESQSPASLPLIDTYRHLGVMHARDGAIRSEVRHRCSAAWATFREGRTRLFRCRRISLRRRGVLLNSLVISKLQFGCGAWPPLGQGDLRKFAGAVFGLYRATLALGQNDDQHLSLAAICALLDLPDHMTIIRAEQLRYVRQLCCSGPDALWALIRQDGAYLGELRSAMEWLYVRVRATCTLPDPGSQWQVWSDLICHRPSAFKGLIKRARGLELCRIQCYAALQALHRVLKIASCGADLEEVTAGSACTEACLICKRGFSSRAAWACHASKKHGYRITASILTGTRGCTLCAGCGKNFANSARLRRHLLHSGDCRSQWGSFRSIEANPPCPNPAEPPVQVEGVLDAVDSAWDPASYNKGLYDSLCVLVNPTALQVWALVVDFVEPLDILRETLRRWQDSHAHTVGVAEAAEDAILMLDPSLCCDTYSPTKPHVSASECCADLPGPFDLHVPFVLSGASATFRLPPPPCPAFCYPFIGGAPLAAARRQSSYVEHVCDILGTAVQQAAASRVCILAPQRALAAVEPAATWLTLSGLLQRLKA